MYNGISFTDDSMACSKSSDIQTSSASEGKAASLNGGKGKGALDPHFTRDWPNTSLEATSLSDFELTPKETSNSERPSHRNIGRLMKASQLDKLSFVVPWLSFSSCNKTAYERQLQQTRRTCKQNKSIRETASVKALLKNKAQFNWAYSLKTVDTTDPEARIESHGTNCKSK
jgi:hypothetical protein